MGAANSHESQSSDNFTSVPLNIDLILHKKSCQMERIKRTLSFQRKKSDSTPLQWQNDKNSVRMGNCSFNVKYLGSIEVNDSRGSDVCEQAMQVLLKEKRKHTKAVLYISGDALRVVDERHKGLILDQTLDKVSFCTPDHHHKKGFAYIARDGTTRRWICYGFISLKDSGERISHAVGCAFQICFEQKQNRGVTVEYTEDGTSFTRFGSFCKTSITERIIDPQSAIIAEPVPYVTYINSSGQRPRPKGENSDVLIRSISMSPGPINQTPIRILKRPYSLTLNDLPSIQEAKNSLTNPFSEGIKPYDHSIVPSSPDPTTMINDALNSNLTALRQSNYPTNPFSPYGYSIASHTEHRQSVIFTPKRGTNPFDDDVIRR